MQLKKIAYFLLSIASTGALMAKQQLCHKLVPGLQEADCNWIIEKGIADQGINDIAPNNKIWIGNQGPNIFNFTNYRNEPISIILWESANDSSSFVSSHRPLISYSLPNLGDSVLISLANNISGAWSYIERYKTSLTLWGQVSNTWGEFTTGRYATVDVSRLITMSGGCISVQTPTGCISDMENCSFHCKTGSSCGLRDSYTLVNCEKPQIGAHSGTFDGQPSGGCGGWDGGGTLNIALGCI